MLKGMEYSANTYMDMNFFAGAKTPEISLYSGDPQQKHVYLTVH